MSTETKMPADITHNKHNAQESESDAVTIRYSSSQAVSRRRFLSGSLALGGSAMLGSTAAFAADCDRNPEQVRRCSDGDTGQSADPVNCGRCGQESTVPSSYRIAHPVAGRAATVESIKSPGVKKISD